MPPLPPSPDAVRAVVEMALAEDLGPNGDLTSCLLIPENQIGTARLFSRVAGVLSGGVLLAPLFGRVDPRVSVKLALEDGAELSPESTIARIAGPARSILTGERVALNLVARLCGIATLTRKFAAACGRARVTDTRKTTPGLRALELYAVRCGGGRNHRFNLSDGILIKDNHIAACGGVGRAVQLARAGAPHTMRIEAEVTSIEQAREAVEAGADVLLLDNMAPPAMRAVVEELRGQAVFEASGGVRLETIGEIGATGVDIVSVGALTHSAVSLDLSLDLAAA
ncbi:MAG: carboxylating nicotinate-nucleotide diphosphorylase [Candidatus Wallbacteria bacterium]|nr:carboxylating nicotinate-nucleotide diphosphorylase [Candidatus Wallbacteria bacterium]